jgi:hypothetical protein
MANNKTNVAQDRRSTFFDPLWPFLFFQKVSERALRKSVAPRHERTAPSRRHAPKKRRHSRRRARR